jgi:acyl-CoA thioester hydrolase
MKNSSFGIHHFILNNNDEVAAEGHDVIVMYDFNKNEKVAIPDWLRQKVEALEKKNF